MNYKKIYKILINFRTKNPIKNGYYEIHHIVPKSLGGKDTKDNLVKLTAKEHYICHLLLTKMYKKGSRAYYSMIKAWQMMSSASSGNQSRCVSKGAMYEILKKEFSKAQSVFQTGNGNSQFGTVWIWNEKTLERKKIKKSENLPKGWMLGNKLIRLKEKIEKQKEKKKKNKLNLKSKIKKYCEYYEIYDKFGFDKFVEITGYNKTKANLVQQMIKYVENFSSQNGKIRGNVERKKSENYIANNSKTCIVDNVEYKNLTEASRKTGINRNTLSRNLVNGVFYRDKYEKGCLTGNKKIILPL